MHAEMLLMCNNISQTTELQSTISYVVRCKVCATESCYFPPTQEIMGAQNFNFAPSSTKLEFFQPQILHFWNKCVPRINKFSDRRKFRGEGRRDWADATVKHVQCTCTSH